MDSSVFLTPIGSWQEQDTHVSRVLHALAGLRDQARAAARVSVVNLVVIVSDEDAAQRALDALTEMGARHPARTLVLCVAPDAASSAAQIDARVTLFGSFVSGHAVCSDVVEFNVFGPVVDHLRSLVDPLCLADIPTVVWYFETEPSPTDSLLGIANSVIVDTKELGASFALDAIAQVAERNAVVDLSWLRLLPWRELLANLFQGELLNPFLNDVLSVHIKGKAAPRRLLSGWIAAQLHLPLERIYTRDARHVSIQVTCQHDGKTAQFVVEREEEDRVVRATVMIDGEKFYEERVGLHDHPLSYSLMRALLNLSRSPVFERALRTGLEIEDAA